MLPQIFSLNSTFNRHASEKQSERSAHRSQHCAFSGLSFPSPPLPIPCTHPHRWNWIHEVELKFACKSFWLQILGLTVTTIYHHYWNKMGWPRIKINVKKRWEREMRNAWGTNQILLEKANSVPMWSMRMVFPAAYTKCHCKWLKSGFFFPDPTCVSQHQGDCGIAWDQLLPIAGGGDPRNTNSSLLTGNQCVLI